MGYADWSENPGECMSIPVQWSRDFFFSFDFRLVHLAVWLRNQVGNEFIDHHQMASLITDAAFFSF